MNKYFFSTKYLDSGKRVITLTATFPSLIQPWLINQLIQIIKHGGENRIIARREEIDVYATNLNKYNLLDYYSIAPEKKYKLFLSFFFKLLSPYSLFSIMRGTLKYPRVLKSSNFTLKEKLFSFFLLPYMGMRNVDIVHSHSEMAGNKFMPIIEALNVPLVITFHGLPPVGVKPVSSSDRDRYISKASKILVNTNFAKTQYINLGADPGLIEVIPQGTILDDFPFKPKPFPLNNKINILTVGRLNKEKGQEYVINAIPLLMKHGFAVKYTLVGGGPDKERLIDLANNLGIADSIEIISPVPHHVLREIYNSSHIFILPSLKSQNETWDETQGVVLQEAQASGLITIATNAGGIPECIDNNISGFLINDRSSEEIKSTMLKLLSSPSDWETYQNLGRRWVEENYDINVIGNKLNEVYDNIIMNK